MKVSVIVPLYNKARYVERALRSIASQTFSDFEVIVVDDGSTDDGPAIVSRFGDRRFRLFSQENRGPGAARNRGAREASAELLAFLDADDEWSPPYLERAVALLDANGPGVASVSCGYLEMPAGRATEAMWRRRGLKEGLQQLTADTAPLLAVHMLAFMSPWNTVVRKPVFDALGGFFDSEKCLYAEDAFLWLKVLLNRQVYFHFEPLAYYHIDASALARNLKGPRPVEPFLKCPEGVREACPKPLRGLLEDVLAIRALKTASMLGFWGRYKEGRELKERFAKSKWRLPYFFAAAALTSPLGGVVGQAWRKAGRSGRR